VGRKINTDNGEIKIRREKKFITPITKTKKSKCKEGEQLSEEGQSVWMEKTTCSSKTNKSAPRSEKKMSQRFREKKLGVILETKS